MALAPYIASIILMAGIYIVFSFGLNLEFGTTGLVNFGHVAFMGIGAYTAAILYNQGIPFLPSALIAIAFSGIAGLLIALPTAKLRVDYLAIFTLGFSIVLGAIFKNEEWLTKGPMGMHLGIGIGKTPVLGSIFHLMLIVIVTMIAIYLLLEHLLGSPWGRVLRAIREDEEVPKAVGKNVFNYKCQALLIGSAVAGLSGILLVLYLSYVNPYMFLPITTFYAWIIVIVGGTGNYRGTILGGLLFWGALSGTRFLGDWLPITEERFGAIRMVLVGIIIVLIVRFKPEGILGRREEMVLEKEARPIS